MIKGVGIDVSKRKLDVALGDGTRLGTFENDVSGLEALPAVLEGLEVGGVVLEPSGGYERLAACSLHALGLTVVLVPPQRARHFAKALGFRAKTDTLDAVVLARMAEQAVDDVPPWSPPTPEEEELRALVHRRQQLVALQMAESRRLWSGSPSVRESIEAVLHHLRIQLRELKERIDACVAATPAVRSRVARLESVRGVGRLTAVQVAVWLPELGQLNRREVAALAGVAPMNRDSGTFQGRRFTSGGRADLRRALYMATLTGVRWNEHLRVVYERLVERGKPKKVALVACMRKLLIHLNALERRALEDIMGARV